MIKIINDMEEFSNSYSLINNFSFKEKYKALKLENLSLDTELKQVKSENNIYKEEIKKMK